MGGYESRETTADHTVSLNPSENSWKLPRRFVCAWLPAAPLLKQAEKVGNEVEALYTNGPSGGGGAVKAVKILFPLRPFDTGRIFL